MSAPIASWGLQSRLTQGQPGFWFVAVVAAAAAACSGFDAAWAVWSVGHG